MLARKLKVIALGLEASFSPQGCDIFNLLELEKLTEHLLADTVDAICFQFTPDISSQFLSFLLACSRGTPLIATAKSVTPSLEQELLKKGVSEVVAASISAEALGDAIARAVAREAGHSVALVKQPTEQRFGASAIIAKSAQMKAVLETIRRLSPFHTTVLITGESGTGKELVARALHHNSPRRGKPFIAINCGAIPENLVESELFGHRKGAFTDATRDKHGLFEEASGGTIFLDEIGELPVHLQVKLLRALQEQQIRPVGDERTIDIDIRVIAATLRDLEDDVAQGRFREDLYYRLNVVTIDIAPLRERPDDISALVDLFMKKHRKRLGLEVHKIEKKALDAMLRYAWRGNVRELENCVERAMVLSESDLITLDLLPAAVQQVEHGPAKIDSNLLSDNNLSIKQQSRSLEIGLILKALERTGGNRTHAAKVLEISHRALLYKLKEYGLGER